jgi:cellulose 1,4-beta-cellobiosidase
MKYFLGLAALAAVAVAAPAESPTETIKEREPSRLNARAACASAVTLTPGSNPFSGCTLHANSEYAKEVNAALANMTDTSLAAKASAVAKVGTFLWL